MQLSNLSSLGKKRKRIGRGGARGGTSGRGSKGQKARSGPTLGVVFEGGQSPLTRRLPKRGFNNKNFETAYEIISISKLSEVFKADQEVNRDLLIEAGLIAGKFGALLKVLGNGSIDKKLNVKADAFSKSAKEAIEKVGGKALLTKEM